MKTTLPLLFLLTLLVLFTSCKEKLSEIKIEDPLITLMNLPDSCSYYLNGKICVLDSKVLIVGNGTGEVNKDEKTGISHPDSILYWMEYRMENKSLEDLTFQLVKKYFKKNRLTLDMLTFSPKDKYDVFTVGIQPFAVDFLRYNTRNGVAIDLRNNNDGWQYLKSYLPGYSSWKTTIEYDYQDNSTFEITKFEKLPNGKHFLEAKFALNAFSYKVKIGSDNHPVEEAIPKRIEHGYLRFQL